ncbi:hypothetical protein RRG08_050085 [Elysia crispata]|uniref:Uncharacterized protein n=2 Tax=Elysia crispata TaxID=231223 RepID=A0AAE1EDL6_9GAST|nr:hypothetical protein RRG08_050085 [Elysia crispata]
MDSGGIIHRLCHQLSSVIGSLGPSTVFGYKGVLLIFAFFWPMRGVRLKQIKEILQHSKRDGQMVKSLTASLVSREEEERHQMNLNENEQLKKQITEWTCSRPCHVSHLHRLRIHATHLRGMARW